MSSLIPACVLACNLNSAPIIQQPHFEYKTHNLYIPYQLNDKYLLTFKSSTNKDGVINYSFRITGDNFYLQTKVSRDELEKSQIQSFSIKIGVMF